MFLQKKVREREGDGERREERGASRSIEKREKKKNGTEIKIRQTIGKFFIKIFFFIYPPFK